MKEVGWFSKRPDKKLRSARIARAAASVGIAALLMMTGRAVAQDQAPGAPIPTPAQMTVPDGYTAHHTVDLGGRMSSLSGSEAMYDTLVNLHSGPRVLGESFEMRALPGKKNPTVDYLKAFGSGFGGDPYNFAKLSTSKSKYFDFTGLFRRDRQYSDYDLLGNPFIVPGKSIPIGPSNAPVDSVPWGPVNHSSMMFNTVRRMLDTNLTVMPVSKVKYRFGYARNVFEGPTLSPSYSIFKYDALLRQYQRNSTDDYTAGLDWKPVERTTVSIDEIWTRYKMDSYFTLDPNGFQVQEADGTPAYLGNWDSQTPYGIAACNTTSMGSGYTSKTEYTILSPNPTPGGLPIINPACAVVTSYTRTQPTRINIPTTILRFQSSSIENVSMAGDIRYTSGTMHMPSYYENVQGLNGGVRSQTYSGGYGQAHRNVVAGDFGVVWQATKTVSLAEQVNYSSAQQPGYSNIPAPTTLSTPTGAGNQTINYLGPLVGGKGTLPHGINGVLTYGYFGQMFLVNNLTASWEFSPKATAALTYRYTDHKIGQGVPHKGSVQMTDPVSGEVEIQENGGILNLTYRPTAEWEVSGSAGVFYADNAFTPVGARQTKHYRVHTMYKPKTWATISAAFNDRERHNNTNNNQEAVATGETEYYGPIDHVDYFRTVDVGAVIAPSDTFSLDLNYGYSDVFTATNICLTSGAAAGYPGTATLTANGAPNICPGIFARGSTTQLVDWFARDFEDAPTHNGSFALVYKPNDQVNTQFGYRISSVNGSRLFDDARDVNGALTSNYQTPFMNVAWTSRPGLTWKAEYNYFGYQEGGHSGPQYCSLSTSATASVVPCTSLPYPTGLTEPTSGLTAPRAFRANNVTLGVHYEF